jgi:hypothetical protein
MFSPWHSYFNINKLLGKKEGFGLFSPCHDNANKVLNAYALIMLILSMMGRIESSRQMISQ